MAAASDVRPFDALATSRLNTETVGKAVDALRRWSKSKADSKKPQLLEQEELLYLVLTLKKIPPNARVNPFKIPLPHPLFDLVSPLEICLIFDDGPKSPLTSDAVKKKIQSESIPISKVLKLSKLKSDYRPFEAKRQLLGSYDLFFADKRIIPLLPRLLGKHFFKKKKIPIPIDLRRKDWSQQLRHSCSSTLLYLKTGTCSILKVGLLSQDRDQLIENVIAATEGAAEIVPRKWANIRSLHLKLTDSLALPIHQAVPEMGLKIEGFKKEEKKVVIHANVDSENGVEKQKDKSSSVNKKVRKKGRIHEVRYMDSNLEELMAKMVDDEDETDKANGLGDVDMAEKTKDMKKEKKKKITAGELPKKSKKLKKGQSMELENGLPDAEVAGNVSEANESDELGNVKRTEKKNTMPKKKKKKTEKGEMPREPTKLIKDQTVELKKALSDVKVTSGQKKQNKRSKDEEAMVKEKKNVKKKKENK